MISKLTEVTIHQLNPVNDAGLFRYMFDAVNGSCYACLENSTLYIKYVKTFFQENPQSIPYKIFFISLILVLFTISIFTVFLIGIYIHKLKLTTKVARISSIDSWTIVIILGLFTAGIFFVQVDTLHPQKLNSAIHNKSNISRADVVTSVDTLLQSTIDIIKTFMYSSFIDLQNNVHLINLIDSIFQIVKKNVISIVGELMSKLNSRKLLNEAPIIINNLVELNNSFVYLSKFYVNDQSVLNNYLGQSQFFLKVAIIYYKNSCFSNKTAVSDKANREICDKLKQKLDSRPNTVNSVKLKLDNAILIKRAATIAKSIFGNQASIQFIKREIDKIKADVDKIVPDTMRDLKQEISIANLTKLEKYYHSLLQTKIRKIFHMFDRFSNSSKGSTDRYALVECYAIVYLSIPTFMTYLTLLILAWSNKINKVHYLSIVLVVVACLCSVVALVLFSVLAVVNNEVLRNLSTRDNQSHALDAMLSSQMQLEWRKLLNQLNSTQPIIFSLLRLPRLLPDNILAYIRADCSNNLTSRPQSLLAILGFVSVIRLEDSLPSIPLFRDKLAEIKVKANVQMLTTFRQLKVPEINKNQQRMLVGLLTDLINEKETSSNLEQLSRFATWSDWVQQTVEDLRPLVAVSSAGPMSELLGDFLVRLHVSRPAIQASLDTTNHALRQILASRDLPTKLSLMLQSSAAVLASIRREEEIRVMLSDVVDTTVFRAISELQDLLNNFFEFSFLPHFANCRQFVTILDKLAQFPDYTTNFAQFLLASILQTFLFLGIVVTIYLGVFFQ